MKILLYTEGLKTISKSGLGKAITHQMKALEDNQVEYTTNLKDDYDLLHINFYGPKSYWYAKRARKKGKKIVYHAHSTEEDFRNSFLFSNLVSPLFKKWLIRCYRLGDYIITPTEYSKKLLENYHMNRPIKAISNGVDTKFFERDEKAGLEFRKKYGYQKNDKVIVGIGLYIKRKGILDFVELAKRMPQYQFIWFGYSPLWASPHEIKKAVQTKLPNLCFAGYVESSVIKSALSGADLYLFPTLEETEGVPIIEALSSKIPTLIRDIPVFEEYQENKVVYKAKNLEEFEEKIEQILEHKLPDLTTAGYKEAKKKDVKTVGQELIQTYQEVLKMDRVEEEKPKNGCFLAVMLILLGLVIAMLFTFREKTYETSFEAMSSPITVTFRSSNPFKAKKQLKKIEEIYEKYEQLTDREHGPLKEIHQNTSQAEAITIDEDLYNMIRYGKTWYEVSNHIYNIQMGDTYDLWNEYLTSHKGIPTKEALSNLSTEITKISLLKNYQIVNNHANIYLDDIRLGYATKEVTKYLEKEDIDQYLITTSSVIAAGENEEGGKYLLAISNPFKGNDTDALTTIRIADKAVASKGLYQSYFQVDGVEYSTVLDSKTKMPVDYMIGVTVIADDPLEAEVLATTLYSMSIPDGQEFIQQFEDVDVMWAYLLDDGTPRKIITENFYRYK